MNMPCFHVLHSPLCRYQWTCNNCQYDISKKAAVVVTHTSRTLLSCKIPAGVAKIRTSSSVTKKLSGLCNSSLTPLSSLFTMVGVGNDMKVFMLSRMAASGKISSFNSRVQTSSTDSVINLSGKILSWWNRWSKFNHKPGRSATVNN